ncbi:ZIP family metal transporter [Mycolicibacterium palauense]|uniref:hypothetical protein n=1 Tax=Mycolicibacterium palauense TaxID=2034511 RepID=UPI000BFED1F0|nr:hypothetical protein [Mycolicibacterium palauense]
MTTAASLVVFPVLAGAIGGVIAVVRTPSAAVVGGVQHLAAGIVMAAVAGEVLPELRDAGPLWLIAVGFFAAVALLLALSRFEGHGPDGEGAGTAAGAIPVGFLVVVGVDLFIDGLLVGASAAVSEATAIIITVALTAEVLFLGLAVALQLTRSGMGRAVAAAVTAGLSLLVAAGALLGAALLADAGPRILTVVLAFAAAALLWLVVEELLVEAHEVPHRPWMAAMFFIGFLALFSLEGMG